MMPYSRASSAVRYLSRSMSLLIFSTGWPVSLASMFSIRSRMRRISSDLEIQAKEILRIRALMEGMLANDTGQTVERISADIERDKYMTAADALEYGIIDEIFTSLKDVK